MKGGGLIYDGSVLSSKFSHPEDLSAYLKTPTQLLGTGRWDIVALILYFAAKKCVSGVWTVIEDLLSLRRKGYLEKELPWTTEEEGKIEIICLMDCLVVSGLVTEVLREGEAEYFAFNYCLTLEGYRLYTGILGELASRGCDLWERVKEGTRLLEVERILKKTVSQ